MSDRATVTCPHCGLVQFRAQEGACRRCKKRLPTGSVRSTSVVMIGTALEEAYPKPPTAQLAFGEVLPMRLVMQQAAQNAVRVAFHTTKAAKALGISHKRLKQLLREGGDMQDRRLLKGRKRRRA